MVMQTPRSVNIDITSRCNLRCSYCSHFNSPGDMSTDSSTDQWLRFFEELNRHKVMSVCLSGGEPLFREDIKELITGIVKNRMRYSILTNGTLMDEGMAEFIASTRRCNYVQVSLDSSDPLIHDVCRGKGSHEKAVKAIRHLQHHGVSTTARVTINRLNLHGLEKTADFLLNDLNLFTFATNSASYMGVCRDNAKELMLTPEERSSAIDTLLRLDKKYKGRILAQAGPLAEGKTWIKMQKAKDQGLPGFPNGGHLTGCGCTISEIAVRSDGVIVPCTQMSHIELGRIGTDDLKEVWLHHPELKRLRERSSIPLCAFEFCRGCDYIPYCTGNCPALAYNVLGDENHPSPESCLRRFLSSGGILPALK
jgi:SynChlorMet cassette radical SAM/SPASM protein ScmE